MTRALVSVRACDRPMCAVNLKKVDEIEISPVTRPLDARVVLPGSKSITNRAMVLAALAQGRSVLESVLLSDDTRYMSEALRVLGFTVEIDEPARRITVSGRGGTIPAQGGDIFVGGAGTVMRFLVAMVTLGDGRFRIDGNQRMLQRPIWPNSTLCSA